MAIWEAPTVTCGLPGAVDATLALGKTAPSCLTPENPDPVREAPERLYQLW